MREDCLLSKICIYIHTHTRVRALHYTAYALHRPTLRSHTSLFSTFHVFFFLSSFQTGQAKSQEDFHFCEFTELSSERKARQGKYFRCCQRSASESWRSSKGEEGNEERTCTQRRREDTHAQRSLLRGDPRASSEAWETQAIEEKKKAYIYIMHAR